MRRMYSKPQLLEAVESESKVNGIKVFEDIKDKDGHARFIEGNITISPITGITQTYGKWSLSGSHFMAVVAITLAQNTAISVQPLFELNIPQWIKDKIVPIFSDYVITQKYQFWTTGGGVTDVPVYLKKTSGALKAEIGNITSVANDRYARIYYDLLIDNE